MLLAHTESNYNQDVANDRVIEVFFYVSDITDLGIKVECFAWLLAALPLIDKSNKLAVELETQSALEINIDELLASTADHYQAVERVIVALGKIKTEWIFALARKLNTENRRDRALLELIKIIITVADDELDLVFLIKVIASLKNVFTHDTALVIIMQRLSKVERKEEMLVSSAVPLISMLQDIKDAEQKCEALSYSYTFLATQNSNLNTDKLNTILILLNQAWESVEVAWRKIDQGFRITKFLSSYSLEEAHKYMDKTQKFREDIILDTEGATSAYVGCLRLLIRAFSGLLPKRAEDSRIDLVSFKQFIELVPAYGEQAGFWADLALRYYLCNRPEDCRRIVDEQVIRCLDKVSRDDFKYFGDVVISVAPALYVANHVVANEHLLKLLQPQRDTAYIYICEFLLKKSPLADPYDGDVRKANFGDLLQVCELLEKVNSDSGVYHVIESVAGSVAAQRNDNKFSSNQIANLTERFERIKCSFPREDFIQHGGYKIAIDAQIGRIKKSIDLQFWEKLVNLAVAIPNFADSCFVLVAIAEAIPSRLNQKQKEIVEEAFKLIERIPIILDKIGHYEALAEVAYSIDRQIYKKCLESAMKATAKSEKEDVREAQKRFINLAHKNDPEFAASLAALVDTDPARLKSRSVLLKRHIEMLNLKKDMVKQSKLNSSVTSGASSLVYYPEAAWKCLAALNAGKLNTVELEGTSNLVQVASTMPITQAYPILAYTIENAVRRFSNTNEVKTILGPIYDATKRATELAAKVANRTLHSNQKKGSYLVNDPNSTIQLVRNREEALQYLKGWFEREVKDYLKISDPYFGPDDLFILKDLMEVNPKCKVEILTSRLHHKDIASVEQAYNDAWHNISIQDPPETLIVIVGTKTDKSPIHDRWWLTKEGGLILGTSLNGLGNRDSSISNLTIDEALVFEGNIDQYLNARNLPKLDGEKLIHQSFTLS